MNENLMKKFEREVTKDKIDSCLIQHDGKTVFEYYRNNKMKERQHKIYSVTKSILSILVGIAIDKAIYHMCIRQLLHTFQTAGRIQLEMKLRLNIY